MTAMTRDRDEQTPACTSAASGSSRPAAASWTSSTPRPRSRSAASTWRARRTSTAPSSAARAAFDTGPWAASTPSERAAIMARAGELIAERAEALRADDHARGRLAAGDRRAGSRSPPSCTSTGTPRRPSTFPWEEEREGIRGPLLVRRRPVGVVGAIVPWNFPLALSFPKLAPGAADRLLRRPQAARGDAAVRLPAGGGVRRKPACRPACSTSCPPTARSSEALVSHPLVDKISFTGSTRAGRRIAALCGEQIKRCSLELGGKSAAIVLPDADLDAVDRSARAEHDAQQRPDVHERDARARPPASATTEVVEALREQIGAYRGRRPPRIPDVVIGPLVSDVQRERVEGYIATGPRRGSAARARRRPPRSRPRLLRRADDLRRRRQPR